VTEEDSEKLAGELLAQCEAYHEALDAMFAMMILETRKPGHVSFFPAKCGQPWTAMVAGHALEKRARGLLKKVTDDKAADPG
jgi:hypothetical protein